MREPGDLSGDGRSLRFGPFLLDIARRQLFHGSAALHLTPKAFDLIHLLVLEAPRVVSKRELHERLWPGTFVSDASLTGLVKELRRAMEDDTGATRVIRTVHRVGYACDLKIEAALDVDRTCHWLVVRGRRVELHEGENIVGRDPGSDVCLEFPSVSRRHARILIGRDGVALEDLGSKNGTTTGDSAVREATPLRDGDAVAFGTVTGVYRNSEAGMSTETRIRGASHQSELGRKQAVRARPPTERRES